MVTVSTYAVSAGFVGCVDDRGQHRFVWQRRPVALGCNDRDEAVAIWHPIPSQAVDLGQGDLRQEALIEAEFVHDARNRFRLDEVAYELVSQRPRWAIVLLLDGLLEPSLKIQPLPVQFRLGEAETGDAADLREEPRQALLDTHPSGPGHPES